jgi:hypothetical protein
MRWGDYKYVFSEQRKEGTMGVWAEPLNTFWDWNLNHVGAAYGMMDEVFKFVATFKEFPPRSFPPSFNPANLMEERLREIKAGRKLREAFPFLAEPGPAN